jgi:hypothetical protein
LAANLHIKALEEKVFSALTSRSFNGLALEIFHYQLRHNPVYRAYVSHLGLDTGRISTFMDIPFMPITFFKSQMVVSGDFVPGIVFSSSGTGDGPVSQHYVMDPGLYRRSFTHAFTNFYGDPKGYCILGLLPSYLEREGSSLIYMVRQLMSAGRHPLSGFFLYEHDQLAQRLIDLTHSKQKTLLVGVSFALLDFADTHNLPLGENIIVMETGGMKGRREELTREELHQRLCRAFRKNEIHSEYGMTELLSQAYSMGGGRFRTPPWMKVLVRDIQDPFQLLPPSKTGAINIIDLANIHSCAFIETQDIGKIHPDGSFEVLGRTDSSDIRGCSLLISQ